MYRDHPFDPFVLGVTEPSVPPSAGTLKCVRIPIEYMPYIQSGVAQLTKPSVHLRDGTNTLSQAITYASWFSEFLDMFQTFTCESEGYTVGTFIGQIVMGMVGTFPDWILPMNGGIYLKSEYPDLWNVISTSPTGYFNYDTLHFILPQSAGRAMIGAGEFWNTPISPETASGSLYPWGSYGGERTHTLTVSEIPPHTHPVAYRMNGTVGNFRAVPQLDAVDNTSTWNATLGGGGGQAHNNMPPSLRANIGIVWRINEPMSHSFRLRQNSDNPYLLEQSVDNGAYYEAFDYGKIKQDCGRDLGGNLSDLTIINNYISEINTTYGGNVLNIYIEASYGTGVPGTDALRDSTLCYVIYETMIFIDELINAQENPANEPPDFGDLVQSGMNALENMLEYGAIVTGAFTLTGGNPYITALVGLAAAPILKNANDDLVDTWTAYWNGDTIADKQTFYSDLTCCIYSYMQGQTITYDLLYEAASGCLALSGEVAYTEIFKRYAYAIFTSIDLFPVFLDKLQTGLDAQQAGIVLPCPCSQIDVLQLPATSVTGVQTTFDTNVGVTYKITIEGVTQPQAGVWFDAFYSSTDNWTTHSPSCTSWFRVNGVAPTCISYQSSHVYEFNFVGDGNPILFTVSDSNYGDNLGTYDLVVEFCPTC